MQQNIQGLFEAVGAVFSRRLARTWGLAAAAGLAIAPFANAASPITLSDGNATLTIDPSSTLGADSLVVDGVQELGQQGFFYRVGETGGESSVAPLYQSSSVHGNVAQLNYAGDGFDLSVVYNLLGGTGSGAAELSETINLTNVSPDAALDMHLFEYSHFTLDDSTTGNNLAITDGNTANQSGPNGSLLNYVEEGATTALYQADMSPTILSSLEDNSPTTLSDAAGPVAGNAEFAFEYDSSIPASGSYIVSVVQTVTPPQISAVPLPLAAYSGVAVLAGLGAVGVMRRRPSPRQA